MLGDVLDRLGRGFPASRLPQIRACWEEVAGVELARHVEPLGWDGRQLLLAADSERWRQQAEVLLHPICGRLSQRGFEVRAWTVTVKRGPGGA